MFCPKCGHQASNNEHYCIQCGSKLPDASVSNQESPNREEKHNTSNFSPSIIDTVLSDNSNAGDAVVSKKFYIGVLAATVFLPIIGIIMGIIYLLKDHPEEKKAGKMWLMVGIGVGVLNAIILSMGN